MDLMASGVACAIGMMAFSTACGAPPPGNLDIQRMIDKAAERGGTVRVPAGEWEVKPFVLKSNVTLALADGARLLASTNIVDYATNSECPVFIFADCATNVAIVGNGVIDGRGGAFKETSRLRGESQPKTLPLLMRFSRCRDLRLEGFHYINPGSWACHLRNCDGVRMKGVSCFCHCNRMNDGLDIESSNVIIEDCVFDTDDDALCFKTESDRTFPVTNIVVRNCRMGSMCNGIKFGTGSYNVFRDITIENCAVVRPGAAFRFDWRKSIPGVTNRLCGISGLAMEVVDGGGMENVTVRGLTIEGCQTPIFIRHHHRHERVGGEEPYLRNILIENVSGTAESRIASSITGVPARKGASARRPRDITLRNVFLVVPGGGTEGDAAAKIPEKDGAYPESFMFGRKPLPAYGFYVRHADNITFENVEITTVSPDAREKFVFEDCSGCCTYGRADVESKIADALSLRILPKGDRFLGHEAILAEVRAADKAADDAWRALRSQKEYDAHRMRLRARMEAAVGGIDFESTPLNAKIMGKVDRDGYRIEKVVFESRPGGYVTGLVFLPAEDVFKPPYRGILLLCGHSANGKGSASYQRGAVQAARAGFAVLVCDPYAQGERAVGDGRDACAQHNRYGALAALLGQSMARERIRDGMRAIDYLMSRKDVRKDGVGCMGNSGGGTMSAFLAALDDRIVAACPSCYISSIRTVLSGRETPDAEQNVFGCLSFALNHAGLVLAGGNAVRIHCCSNDFFPIAGTRETYAVVRDVAKNCGLGEEGYGITEVPGRHGWKESLRVSSIAWMRRWLAWDESAFVVDVESIRNLDVGFDVKKVDHGLDGEDANVVCGGNVKNLPGFKSLYDYLEESLSEAEKVRPRCSPAELAQIVQKCAGIRQFKDLSVSVVKTCPRRPLPDGTEVVSEIYSFGGVMRVPAVTFIPKGMAKNAVLIVHDDASRVGYAAFVAEELASGNVVMVADLVATGETGGLKRKVWQGTGTNDEQPAKMLYLMGKSLVGMRAEEIIGLSEALAARTGLTVGIVASGRSCIPAAHAFAVRRDFFKNISLRKAPKSWADSLRCGEYIPFANVVTGALLAYDWIDLEN